MANDELSAAAIQRDLGTRRLGQRVVYYERVSSTNDVAKQLAHAGEPEGTLVIADEQTAGRGRWGRAWLAPARSSLLMSLVLRPPLAPAHSPRVTMAVALGTCDAIHAETGLEARLKWHNDLLIGGKKCAGILAETGILGDEIEYMVVGLGVNVNFAASVAGIPGDATTLADELGAPFPRARLARAILRQVERYYLRLCAGENLRPEWAARLVTLGQRVRARSPAGTVAGVAGDVDDDGALLVCRDDGAIARLVAEEVTLSQ